MSYLELHRLKCHWPQDGIVGKNEAYIEVFGGVLAPIRFAGKAAIDLYDDDVPGGHPYEHLGHVQAYPSMAGIGEQDLEFFAPGPSSRHRPDERRFLG